MYTYSLYIFERGKNMKSPELFKAQQTLDENDYICEHCGVEQRNRGWIICLDKETCSMVCRTCARALEHEINEREEFLNERRLENAN